MQKFTKALAILMDLRYNIVTKKGADEIQHRKVHRTVHGKMTFSAPTVTHSTDTNSERHLAILSPMKIQSSTERRANKTFAATLKGIAITSIILLLLKP